MRTPMLRPLFLLAPLALLAAPALADEIVLVDGSTIPDCSIVTETFKEVEYREGSRKKTVPSEKVLRIQFSAMPELVDRAESSAAQELVQDAIADLTTYVDGFLSGGKRERFEWAPAYAAHRLVELHMMAGEHDKAVGAADKLIEKFPQSRYVPFAFLNKAQAQAEAGQAARAKETLKGLETLVQTHGLSQRWQLEGELARLRFDPDLKGKAKRDALVELSGKAGAGFPTVRAAADVAEGEAYLEAKDFAAAEKIFKRITDDPKALRSTLAAAYTGLGECVFQRASKAERDSNEGRTLHKDALLAFMRVVVVYGDQTRYVPKAMFYAARILDLEEDPQSKENAQKLYRSLIRTYDGTQWANEARGFRKR